MEMDTKLLIEHEAKLRMLQERNDALQLVLGWLLACQPDDSALRFLSSQANELDQPGHSRKYPEHIALLDELAEDVLRWHEQWRPGNTPQRS